MDSDSVRLTVDLSTGIASITLNRPAALNALDPMMASALDQTTAQVAADRHVRALVITGAGAHFTAGGDIKFFRAMLELPGSQRKEMLDALIDSVHASVIRLREMNKPVLASVRGAVAGFGFSLMNACDLAIAADDSYFTLAYCRIGASPDGGGTYSLPRLVSLKQAMEIALLGERFEVQAALRLGLVNRVVPVDQLRSETESFAIRLAEGPTAALGRTKRLINESLNRTLVEQLRHEKESFVACALSDDFSRGVRAFVEKRQPHFTGD